MDKQILVVQLEQQLREVAHEAYRASADAAKEAREGATGKENRADARIAIECAGIANGQSRRARRAFAQLGALSGFHPRLLSRRSPIELGAIVEVEDEDTGEGRTFFFAPVGAGITLSGPGGDGHLSVVTPASPIGKAVLGHRVGDVVDVTVDGDVREWSITWVE